MDCRNLQLGYIQIRLYILLSKALLFYITMPKEISKKQSTRQTTQKPDLQQTISQALALLDTLFNMRLIDKICRPISVFERTTIITEYKQKFNDLHQKLDTILKQASGQIKGNDQIKNEQRSNRAHKPIDFKSQIRKIESKYIEIFRDGSFKYYDKVAKLYALPENLYLINIQTWTHEILDSTGVQKKCC